MSKIVKKQVTDSGNFTVEEIESKGAPSYPSTFRIKLQRIDFFSSIEIPLSEVAEVIGMLADVAGLEAKVRNLERINNGKVQVPSIV